MSYLKTVFARMCPGGIFGSGLDGRIRGHLSERLGTRVSMRFEVSAHVESATVDFPDYIKQYLMGYRLTLTAPDSASLSLDFRKDADQPYMHCLRKALNDAAERSTFLRCCRRNAEGEDIWQAGPERLGLLIDHLAKPGVRNAILTEANQLYAQHKGMSNPLMEPI